MRVAAILSIVIMLSAFQCRRNCHPEGSYGLQGKWKFTEYYISPGNASINWQPAPQGQTFIEFRNDGTVASDLPMIANYNRYEMKNDSSLVLYGAPAPNQFPMGFKIEGKILTLLPPCFEGCAYKFRRE